MAVDRVPKRVRLPYGPIVGYGEGDTVRLGPGDFWRVDRATLEPYNGAMTVFLWLSPLEPGEVLLGFGEWVDPPPIDVEVVE